MEQMELEERPGLFTRLLNRFQPQEVDEEMEADSVPVRNTYRIAAAHRYQITVRRQIVSFQDAVAAADGLKRGEQQILNLTAADAQLREKIKDFMCGVNYSQEGTWEEVGENVFLLAPTSAYVEVAPASPRMQATKN
ncbi:MAG TPA: cell division protein SepF [Fimbriimonadaceae bacterium]|nr:cell division protein SepF [Fimbriimonadaceae bacterium]HRJ31986.1 cell division protein SepF [Fimbriimonadaceae bacterium]